MADSSARKEIRPGCHAFPLLAHISASASLALVIASADVAQAGVNVWTRSGPASVRALVVDPIRPRTLYAGTALLTDERGFEGGVFKSIDSGRTWNQASNGLSGEFNGLHGNYITALAIDPTAPATLYTGDLGRVFKSTDAGEHWTPTTLVACSIAMLVVDPIAPNALYAVTSNFAPSCKRGGTFKSLDQGDSWTPVGPGTRAVAVDPLTSATLYAGSYDDAFKSIDAGVTWTPAGIPLVLNDSVTAIAIDPAMPDTLYAATDGEGVFKSTDGADSWEAVNNGLSAAYVGALAIDPVSPEILYAGTTGGVFRSEDGGDSWDDLNVGLTGFSSDVLAIDPVTPTTLYTGTLDGVYAIEQVPPACTGDCTRARGVFVDDLVTLASIALGVVQPAACPNGLPLGGTVDVAVLVDAVNNALSGCVA